MATVTVTPSEAKRNTKQQNLLSENERYLRACSDIANALIIEYEASLDRGKPKKDVNLNKLRGQVAKKHRLGNQPPLTAIIAAVPEHYKKYILPKLIAKPISMCACVDNRMTLAIPPTNSPNFRNVVGYCGRCSHV